MPNWQLESAGTQFCDFISTFTSIAIVGCTRIGLRDA